MKKFLAFILSFVMILSLVTASFAAEGGSVEISFKVGDSTLLINGSPVTVETPYVTDGSTLVPLRVITEAFGAAVTWLNETKTIILDYPDVSVTLQIGSTKAIVNTHEETLPVPPTLSENGVTMVPLRFLSETFGATVSYDNETSAITVIKESGEESVSLEGSETKAYIGDSYYGWTMATPTSMMMSDRDFDGRSTEFTDESGNIVSIKILDVDPTVTTDQDFSSTKESLSSYTLIQADKTTDSDGNFKMHFKVRSKEYTLELISIRTSLYYFDLSIMSKYNSSEAAALSALSDSFSASYAAGDDVRDLSNVENGYRTYSDSDMKFTVKVPSYCSLDDSSLNEIYFSGENGDYYTVISLGVYSKSDDVSSKILAESDSSTHKKYANTKYVTVTDVFPYTDYSFGENAYYYGIRTSSLPGGDFTARDIFFEKGDYVYNLYINTSEKNNVIDIISASFSTEELDSSSVGSLLRYELDRTTTYASSYSDRWEITLPFVWSEYSNTSSSGALYKNKQTNSLMFFSVTDSQSLRPSDTKDYVSYVYDSQKKDGATMLKNVTEEKFGKSTFYTFSYSTTNSDGSVSYFTYAAAILSGKIYYFVLADDADYYSGETMNEFKEIVASLKIS